MVSLGNFKFPGVRKSGILKTLSSEVSKMGSTTKRRHDQGRDQLRLLPIAQHNELFRGRPSFKKGKKKKQYERKKARPFGVGREKRARGEMGGN